VVAMSEHNRCCDDRLNPPNTPRWTTAAPSSSLASKLRYAPMESFFHTLKTELVHHQHYATREQAKRDIFAYIEG